MEFIAHRQLNEQSGSPEIIEGRRDREPGEEVTDEHLLERDETH